MATPATASDEVVSGPILTKVHVVMGDALRVTAHVWPRQTINALVRPVLPDLEGCDAEAARDRLARLVEADDWVSMEFVRVGSRGDMSALVRTAAGDDVSVAMIEVACPR